MTIVIVAEKPSVARDIAKVVGASEKCNGYLEGNGYQVTWAIGHLVGIAQPHEMQEKWKSWNRDLLPMLPETWPLVVSEGTKSQFKIVKKLLKSPDVEYSICATDAGREGELIYRYIYEKSGAKCPAKRLWISSLTEASIREGFRKLYPIEKFDQLADSAKARSRSDWLVGMNLSRAYSTTFGENFSVGRVQTPTLSIIVDREEKISNFTPEDYLEIEALFTKLDSDSKIPSYKGVMFDQTTKKNVRIIDQKNSQADKPAQNLDMDRSQQAGQIVNELKKCQFAVDRLEEKKSEIPPPFLFDLTELQRHANRMFGFSAKKTLEIAQQLYEQKKLISYPRTDCRHLSEDIQDQLPNVVEKIMIPYTSILKESTGKTPLGKRFIDNSKITDHHAIIPTGVDPKNLSKEQSVLYELICRRLLMAWQDNHIYSTTKVLTKATAIESSDKISPRYFMSRGKVINHIGWKCLEGRNNGQDNGKSKFAPATLPSYLSKGLKIKALKLDPIEKQTTPPPRFNDATLLTAMETAGSCLDDKELSDAMRQKGLGTPATRSSIIETLIQRDYVMRDGKAFHALKKGIKLIEVVHPEVKSPKMTGEWEWGLSKIQDGSETLPNFSEKIGNHIIEIIGKIRSTPVAQRARSIEGATSNYSGNSGNSGSYSNSSTTGANGKVGTRATDSGATTGTRSTEVEISTKANRRKTKPEDLGKLLKKSFGFDSFRPNQEEVCRDIVKGHDAILVMPTGAGKSLCYQLPGLATSGTTLIISPLIALMEDQVAKLKELGLKAECMHSGNTRQLSREICLDYLAARLDYIFVAPERLGVPGFVSMLGKRKPTLIAIDEAHCISQWGHDFRPDYRMLRSRLEPLRPTTIVATTATATPRVQKDIVEQLGLKNPKIHAHGFRRTNIMIETVEITKSERISACLKLLKVKSRLPAIIYAPTRKQAEECAAELEADTKKENSAGNFEAARVGAYHAGMTAKKRSDIQTKFLGGDLDVIVATVAFGMGIDKSNVRTVIHLAFPGSIEGYYQEIGRAGRDGEISRAILFYSYADIKTHEFFHKKNYPEPKVLERILADIGPQGCHRESIDFDGDKYDLESHIEKLWVHGGIKFDEFDMTHLTGADWKTPYEAQRIHTAGQFAEVSKYAANDSSCRMLQLMAHFADQDAGGTPCGVCDVCAPDLSLLQTTRNLRAEEIEILTMIMDATYSDKTMAAGPIFRNTLEKRGDSRQDFEKYVNLLVKENFIISQDRSFHKNGKDIPFKVLHKTYKFFDEEACAEIKIADLNFTPKKRKARKSRSGASSSSGRGASKSKVDISGYDESLYENLKAWRLEESKRSRMPAFTVLGDRSLQEIALRKPASEEQLLDVNGVGPAKYKKFGKRILSIISSC